MVEKVKSFTHAELTEMRQKAGNLIDAEYEHLQEMTPQDLYEYLSSAFPGMLKAISDTLWKTMIGSKMVSGGSNYGDEKR